MRATVFKTLFYINAVYGCKAPHARLKFVLIHSHRHNRHRHNALLQVVTATRQYRNANEIRRQMKTKTLQNKEYRLDSARKVAIYS